MLKSLSHYKIHCLKIVRYVHSHPIWRKFCCNSLIHFTVSLCNPIITFRHKEVSTFRHSETAPTKFSAIPFSFTGEQVTDARTANKANLLNIFKKKRWYFNCQCLATCDVFQKKRMDYILNTPPRILTIWRKICVHSLATYANWW